MTTSEDAQVSDSARQISLIRHSQFALYWWTRVLSTAGYQIIQVAIQWQIYQLTGSPFHLGMIGLVMFIPVIAGTFLIGYVADHYDRRGVIRLCQISKALGAVILIVASYTGHISVPLIYFVVFIVGAGRAFEGPTLHTIPPSIMPQEVLSRAIAAGNTAQQVAVIGGPFVGGLLLQGGTNLVYYVCFAMFVIASVCITMVKIKKPAKSKKSVTLETIFAGLRYLWTRPIIFGAITLDLGAALVGGVTALLPIFAKDVLGGGPFELGLLRASPAIGALIMGFVLSNIQINRHAGRIMVGAVVLYGLSLAVFGFSTWLWLSMLMLAMSGAADAVSVVVRHSLVQTRTPNEMLGRVMAVNSTFTGTTSNLGQFESGLVASLIGTMPAAIVGGIGAAAIAVLWIRLFPDFWRVQSVIPEQ
ncbi:MAG TPA: MFS transporter [Xanthobacteraceae bacterium]|nr:MFS transporter [Xanthobacteraceae bacterium]